MKILSSNKKEFYFPNKDEKIMISEAKSIEEFNSIFKNYDKKMAGEILSDFINAGQGKRTVATFYAQPKIITSIGWLSGEIGLEAIRRIDDALEISGVEDAEKVAKNYGVPDLKRLIMKLSENEAIRVIAMIGREAFFGNDSRERNNATKTVFSTILKAAKIIEKTSEENLKTVSKNAKR